MHLDLLLVILIMHACKKQHSMLVLATLRGGFGGTKGASAPFKTFLLICYCYLNQHENFIHLL